MARIEWIKLRLQNWALWKDREAAGGLGFKSASAFLTELVDHDRYRESALPVDEVDAGLTNDAVETCEISGVHEMRPVVLSIVIPKGLTKRAYVAAGLPVDVTRYW